MNNIVVGFINQWGNLEITDFGRMPKNVRRVIGKTVTMPVEFLPAGVEVKAVLKFDNKRAEIVGWTFNV